jgi:hypothetical protein
MEALFSSISLVLFLVAMLTLVLVVREALPLLDSEDQIVLRKYWKTTRGFGTWRRCDRVIKRAWSEHTRSFPKSRKRLLFAAFLIAAAVSVMFYPLWLFVGGK